VSMWALGAYLVVRLMFSPLGLHALEAPGLMPLRCALLRVRESACGSLCWKAFPAGAALAGAG